MTISPITVNAERPARQKPAGLDALTDVGVAQVLDALGLRTALDHRIKPLPAHAGLKRGFLGWALTVDAGPRDNLGVYAAIKHAEPGDVIVIATDGYSGTGVLGDILLGAARNKGVAGVVTDGLVRDAAGISEIPVPVYCRGVSPNAPSRSGPAKVGFPISLGGVQVCSSDLVFCDGDGVAIVPPAAATEIDRRLTALLEAEEKLDSWLADGHALWPELDEFVSQNTILHSGA